MIQDNLERHKLKPYDPVTGEGAVGIRERIFIEDAPYQHIWLPVQMLEEPLVKLFLKTKSIKHSLIDMGYKPSRDKYEDVWIMFCELRYKYDFEYWAITCAKIQDKLSGIRINFKLNGGQRIILESLENQRVKDQPIRSINLKTRQIGGSTFFQIYSDWIQIIHKENWSSVICAHVKDAAITVRDMFETLINDMIPINGTKFNIKPFKQTQNIKVIPERGCRITVGSAEEPDSVRSQDVKIAHFSEVAKYPNTDKKSTAKLIGSIVGTIPKIPYTLIVFESTPNGIGEFFYEEWQKAIKGESAYEPVFVPWFKIEIYSQEFNGTYYNRDGKITNGTIEDFVASMDTYEKNLFITHKDCTLENLNWYRGKRAEMASDEEMKQDFPSDDVEAFINSGTPAYDASHVEALRKDCIPPVAICDIIADSSPAEARINSKKRKACLQNIKLIEVPGAVKMYQSSYPKEKLKAEMNRLKIWEYPDMSINVKDRYITIYDPSKGKTDKADFGVIVVLDRYWRMYGGNTEVVAELRGRDDKDIVIWRAAQIAKLYNSLLVIESNTYDSQEKDDDTEFIYEIISEYYSNLYSRTPADKLRENAPIQYGFNTNRKTKPALVANYVTVIREKFYIEKSHDALNEARWYEKSKKGKYGAIQGKHDDIIMTRMIGLWVDFEMDLPRIIEQEKRINHKKPVGEAVI